eukprot:3565738-Amphidinium_carterae.1
MLADGLTKREITPEYLRQALNGGEWSTNATPMALAAKRRAQEQRKARKMRLKAEKKVSEDGCEKSAL